MKKNEEPHFITVVFSNQNDVGIDSFNCSCAAGKGLCQHTIRLTVCVKSLPTSWFEKCSADYFENIIASGMCQTAFLFFFGENKIFKVELNCVWVWE